MCWYVVSVSWGKTQRKLKSNCNSKLVMVCGSDLENRRKSLRLDKGQIRAVVGHRKTVFRKVLSQHLKMSSRRRKLATIKFRAGLDHY